MRFLDLAMEKAVSLGADYADIRIQKTSRQGLYVENYSIKESNNDVIHGYGIRVLKDGAWGFAHSNQFNQEAVIKTVLRAFEIAKLSSLVRNGSGIKLANEKSYIATYRTPVKKDPFLIPLKEKTDLFLEINHRMLNLAEVKKAVSYFSAVKDEKLFASTLGSRLDISTTYINPMLTAYAMTPEDTQSRTFDEGGRSVGWEWMDELDLLTRSRYIAEEAVMKVHADELKGEARRSLILDPNHLGLTMHESVGHPTELDRVLGWEADFAGISFATPEKLKNYKYGSDIVNFVGDNTLESGLATAGFDDDGVPGQKWYIIKNGVLNEYGTTRDTAPFIGLDYSRGCSRATYYYDQPINRIPNLYMLPGEKDLSPAQLISDTDDGIYIQGRGSFSIDQHRVNFQFGGDFFWEVKNGKLIRPLKKVLYRSCNPEFWNSCDAICDKRYWQPFGVVNCGKGQPGQTARMTHGASTARFRGIKVGGSK